MEKFFQRLPFPVKLLVIGLIPLLVLVFVAFQLFNEKTKRLNEITALRSKILEYNDVTQLLDDLQSERRNSFNYLLRNKGQTDLDLQRRATNNTIAKIKADYPDLVGFESYTMLDKLDSVRTGIDNHTIAPLELVNYYSLSLSRLSTVAPVSVNDTASSTLQRNITAQKLIGDMLTNWGIVRVNVFVALENKQDNKLTAEQQKGNYTVVQTLIKEYQQKAGPENVRRMEEKLFSGSAGNSFKYLDQLFTKPESLPAITADEWWVLSKTVVDDFKGLRAAIVNNVVAETNQLYDKEKSLRDRNIIFLIVAICVVVFVIMYTIRSLNTSINAVKDAALKIGRGETGITLKAVSDDALGTLVHSITEIDHNNIELAKAAEAIGRGDFSVEAKPRSDKDELGMAIGQMKNDLQRYTVENEFKLWLQTGVSDVDSAVRGDKSPERIAKDVLAVIAEKLSATAGLLYVSDEEKVLNYAGGYALHGQQHVQQQLDVGETLTGQVAADQKILHLKDIPQAEMKIATADKTFQPKEIFIVPLMQNGRVEGVMQFGSLQAFPAGTADFLQQSATAIAVALRAAKSKKQLQELFEETQAQSEELQQQHNEMENLNTELEAQAEKLQASEEELKVQQEELLQTNKELEERSRLLEEKNQMIVERNLDIQKKAEELALSTKYKSEFLANMSHELRTPLNSILLLSRLLTENPEQNLNQEQVESAQVIQSSGKGLLSLIDEILDLSKIESGKMELDYAQVPVADLMNDMRMLFQPVARDRGLELIIKTGDDVAHMLQTDKMRLEQILKNLLSNALKFTSKGKVELSVVVHDNSQQFLEFSVTDSGIGIPEEKQHLVFEAFQQADGTTRRKYGGTGLGLSISRELSRLLGGEISLKSTPGKGSTFTVIVPVKKGLNYNSSFTGEPARPIVEAEPVKPTLVSSAAPASSLIAKTIPADVADDRDLVIEGEPVILIIEDDTNFAKALLDYTRKKGYKGLVAVRGDTGIELANRYKPVGVLLDLQLPVKDGWQVMDELKKNPATRHIPVHIMSSLEAKKESLMKGAVDFINKPVAFEQMKDIFEKIEFVLKKEHKKVLILEDNSKHAKALSYFLGTYDVNSEISDSVSTGIEVLKRKEVDCVILDMGLPDMKAYETLEQVKKEKGLENVPVIIFTGKSLSQGEVQRIKKYADTIVVKTAQSYQRILDEVSIFLHLVEENNNRDKPRNIKFSVLNDVLQGKKVLVADDDVRNIFSLTKTLEAHKMQVISAVDGKEALRQLNEHPDIDIVLIDIMMPEMDGYEATTAIRRDKRFKQLPVIAVTAKAMTGDREKCIKAGASDYISKPIDKDQLLSLLRVWLYDKAV